MAGNADKYGSKKGNIIAIKIVIFLVTLVCIGAVGAGAYILVKPKYEEYKAVQEETKKLEEARKAEEEKAAKAAAEKAAAEKAAAEKAAAEKAAAEKAAAEKAAEEKKKLDEQKALEEAQKAAEYVVADSNSRYLTAADVEKMSLQQINYAKNEIYARHGRKFQSRELQDFFNSKTWYNGTVEPASFSENVFNEFEKANLELLSKTEFSREPGGYKLDQ